METKPPLPPFTLETAKAKVQAAEDAWNTRDPARVALAYTEDSEWRNRAEFFSGRERDQSVSHPQMGQGTRLPPQKRALVLYG